MAGPFFVSDKLLKIFLVITRRTELGLGINQRNTRRVNDGELLESPDGLVIMRRNLRMRSKL